MVVAGAIGQKRMSLTFFKSQTSLLVIGKFLHSSFNLSPLYLKVFLKAMTFGNTFECSKSADKPVHKLWGINTSVSPSLISHTINTLFIYNPIV